MARGGGRGGTHSKRAAATPLRPASPLAATALAVALLATFLTAAKRFGLVSGPCPVGPGLTAAAGSLAKATAVFVHVAIAPPTHARAEVGLVSSIGAYNSNPATPLVTPNAGWGRRAIAIRLIGHRGQTPRAPARSAL